MTVEQKPLPGNLGDRVRGLRSPDPRAALFACDLRDDGTGTDALAPWLSAAEHTRAARFGTAKLRHRYIVGRAMLRAILGRRLGVPPATVDLERGRRGRPQLRAPAVLDFNVSHTADLLLVGLAAGVTIGVDVERADRAINTNGIARRCLTAAEQAIVAPLAREAARLEVLERWTCKEAMSKATGDAMSAPFRRLDIRLGAGLRLVAGPPPYDPANWALHRVALDGYLATLALWSGRPVEASDTGRAD
ncbi:MAG TPA: 4'-phosphopantetheinyl transferase superfamily protein [Casimicrobiaceae bacterium]|nr:4'-phosphopantetheinyl transferase superfamily protein [Casimicrobiaceae bacterium]